MGRRIDIGLNGKFYGENYSYFSMHSGNLQYFSIVSFISNMRRFGYCVYRRSSPYDFYDGFKGVGLMGALNALLDKPNTVLPSALDSELATESSRILSSIEGTEATSEFRVRLEGGEVLRLPSAVKTLLMHLLTEMSRGNAVTIIPIHAELTTQEAADFLNVSRPYLIGLLEKADIKFHMVGTHRRIKFEDLAAYKRQKDHDREEAMNELAKQAQEQDMGY